MERPHCLNCDTALYPKQNFCPYCGQRADTNRYTFRELLKQFLVRVTSMERGMWLLLKGTAIRPGQTAIEFIQGRRKRYYNPFAFLGVVIALTLLMNSWFKYYDEATIDQQALSQITDQNYKEKYIESYERWNEVVSWEYKYQNTFNLLCCPYFSFFLFLFFKKRGRNMAEINVAYLLFCPVALLLSSFLFTPLVSGFRNSAAASFLQFGDLFVQNLYVAWGMTVFLGFKSFGGFLKVLGVICLSGIIGFILLMIGIYLYIYQGDLGNLRYIFGIN
jgi:hypothetical protein